MEAKAEKVVLRTNEGEKVILCRSEDEKLYASPVNSPVTGEIFTSGTDLYRHKSVRGNIFYYFYHWGKSTDSYELTDDIDARRFLEEKFLETYLRPNEREQERISELFPKILEETA